VTYDRHQPISIVFSEAMDQKSVAAALTVEQDGRRVIGQVNWADDGLTLVFTARYTFYVGSRISVRVAASARSLGGLTMAAAASADFMVSNPRLGKVAYATRVPMSGGIASSTAPWHAMEIYYLNLMNCTRTGKWVTSGGMCSTDSHHTLPAQPALAYNEGLANKVARPYAKAMADRVVLTHYLDGTTPQGRMCSWGGYCGGSWGENVGSPGAANQAGMIAVEIFFQNEYWNRGGHYRNIMYAHFRTAGIGVWWSNSARIAIDFYS
ncbi:MAG: CAP domain-containing protein, partial [Candidatus Limnocylindrales bacterium]